MGSSSILSGEIDHSALDDSQKFGLLKNYFSNRTEDESPNIGMPDDGSKLGIAMVPLNQPHMKQIKSDQLPKTTT